MSLSLERLPQCQSCCSPFVSLPHPHVTSRLHFICPTVSSTPKKTGPQLVSIRLSFQRLLPHSPAIVCRIKHDAREVPMRQSATFLGIQRPFFGKRTHIFGIHKALFFDTNSFLVDTEAQKVLLCKKKLFLGYKVPLGGYNGLFLL